METIVNRQPLERNAMELHGAITFAESYDIDDPRTSNPYLAEKALKLLLDRVRELQNDYSKLADHRRHDVYCAAMTGLLTRYNLEYSTAFDETDAHNIATRAADLAHGKIEP